MVDPSRPQLNAVATALVALAAGQRRVLDIKAAELDRLIREADTREHRRAAFNAIAGKAYRLGGAFETVGALDLDPVTMTGWFAAGARGLSLLTQYMLKRPDRSNAECLAALFASPHGAALRTLGVWAQWQRLAKLYESEVEAVERSEFGMDPAHHARRKKPTSNQTYLAAEICRLLQLEPRRFATRGDAYEWLREQSGNPRFWTEPPLPDVSWLPGAVS